MRKLLALTALFGVLQFGIATVAHAQDVPCAPRDSVLSRLAEKYQEVPVHRGLTAAGNMVEIFASEDGSTWTAAISRPGSDDICLTASGTDWGDVAPAPRGAEM